MKKVKNSWSLRIITESWQIRKFIISYFLILPFYFLFSICAFGQENPTDIEPPPLRIISKDETTKLEAEKDVKRYTKLAVFLMEEHIKKAETLSSGSQYQEMFGELGAFHSLVDKSLVFLNDRDNRSGKILNNFKFLEINLRTFLPRLEIIRRELPFRFEFYTRKLIQYVRDARSRAIEPFYGDSVVPNAGKGS